MKIMPVQKQTTAGQRTRFKAFVVVGDNDGHVGLGVTGLASPTPFPARCLASAAPSRSALSQPPVVPALSLPRSPRRCSNMLVSKIASPAHVAQPPLVVTL